MTNIIEAAPRIIPVLLLDGFKLVKTVNFSHPIYVGDPVNVLSIFNDLEVDEIIILDINGSRLRKPFNIDSLCRISSECFIPLSVGGGISSVDEALAVISNGAEKVIVNTILIENPEEVHAMVALLGSQAVVGAVDVRSVDGNWHAFTRGGEIDTGLTLLEWCRVAEQVGVGEVMVTSIDREGTRQGYDLDAIKLVTQNVMVPVIAHGGADTRGDFRIAVEEAGASAVAAGSQLVFQAGRESVLVNYPNLMEKGKLFVSLQDNKYVNSKETKLADYQSSNHPKPGDVAMDGQLSCQRCLITENVPGSDIGDDGTCFYCRLHDSLEIQFPLGTQGIEDLHRLAEKLKAAGRGKKYDCVLGVSGGCDSSYLLKLMVELGVRPLAVHFDNTWNSPIATSNIYSVLASLNVDLETYVVDNSEYDDIYRSFMLAGVKDVEAPTDIGFMGVLYRAAEKHGIKHIVEGHSFRTEGVSPLGWLYMDGGYIKSVHKKYGKLPMRTYPNISFWPFIRWQLFSGIERHRPLYHLDYRKEETKRLLADEFGWQWYGGHHLENRFTAFYHSYLLPTRFGIDFRQIELSALVRSGHLERTEAQLIFTEPRIVDPELLAMVKKRLDFSEEEFQRVLTMKPATYKEFDTYKKRFERMRPFFWVMYKMGRVPRSFYEKFCK